jgi:hypothetical protein
MTVSPFFGESLPLPGERIVFVKPISSVRFFLSLSFWFCGFSGVWRYEKVTVELKRWGRGVGMAD